MRSVLLVCVLALWVGVGATTWDDWNNAIVSNGNLPLDNSHIPAIPSGIKRNKGSDQIDSNTTLRKNQYMFYYNSGGIVGYCKLYCGPRSFLVKDSSNTYYTCYRDQSNQYFGSYGGLPTNCVPDVTGSCSATGLTASSCSSGSIPSSYQSMGFTSCCYGGSNELENRSTLTSHTDLYNSQ